MGQVHQLHLREDAHVDFSVIDILQQSVGNHRYQEIAEDVVLTLSCKITQLAEYADHLDYLNVEKHAAGVVKIARQIGLNSVVRTAEAAAICAARADSTALSAQVSRLLRLAENSISTVVDFGLQAP